VVAARMHLLSGTDVTRKQAITPAVEPAKGLGPDIRAAVVAAASNDNATLDDDMNNSAARTQCTSPVVAAPWHLGPVEDFTRNAAMLTAAEYTKGLGPNRRTRVMPALAEASLEPAEAHCTAWEAPKQTHVDDACALRNHLQIQVAQSPPEQLVRRHSPDERFCLDEEGQNAGANMMRSAEMDGLRHEPLDDSSSMAAPRVETDGPPSLTTSVSRSVTPQSVISRASSVLSVSEGSVSGRSRREYPPSPPKSIASADSQRLTTFCGAGDNRIQNCSSSVAEHVGGNLLSASLFAGAPQTSAFARLHDEFAESDRDSFHDTGDCWG